MSNVPAGLISSNCRRTVQSDQVLFSLIGIVIFQGVCHVHYFISLGEWSCGSGMTFSSFSWLSPALASSDAV